jgi:hypothetical protein
MALPNILLGLILLVFGRKLFWLFVTIAGFLAGMALTALVLGHQPQWVVLVVALGAGLLGALLAVFVERVAFALAGFYAGSYLALIAAQSFATDGNSVLLFLVGGVIGVVLATWIMDWAIIALSCLVGAAAVVQGLDLGQAVGTTVFALLVIAGVFLQARVMTRSGPDG